MGSTFWSFRGTFFRVIPLVAPLCREPSRGFVDFLLHRVLAYKTTEEHKLIVTFCVNLETFHTSAAARFAEQFQLGAKSCAIKNAKRILHQSRSKRS